MKKLIAVLMALTMVVLCGACGKAPVNAPSGKIEGELTVWSWDLALAYLSDVGKIFMEKNPGVKITFEEMGTEQVYNKLTTSLASGTGLPDLVTIEGEQMGKFGGKFPDKFIDLTQDVNAADFLPIKVAEATVGGKILAYPWDAAPCMMFYRKDMYDKAGVNAADIKTWDQFIEAGKKVQEKNPGVAMMPMATSRRDHIFRIMLMQQGQFYFDKDGKSCLNTPEAIGAMEKVKKLLDSGVTMNETDWDNYVTSIKEGKVASVPDGIWMAGTIKDLSPEDSGKWAVMSMPQYSETTTGEASNGGSVLAIPASTKNVTTAKAFASFAMTDLDNLSYGLEKYALYPPYLPVYKLDIFNQADAYFGGQKVNAMFSDIGGRIPSVNYTQNFAEALETAKNAVAKVLLKGEDIKTTMDNLQNEFVAKFGK
ncbi:MAG: sugar ABC transporter substrate-binding protein [Angelakisella sp.]